MHQLTNMRTFPGLFLAASNRNQLAGIAQRFLDASEQGTKPANPKVTQIRPAVAKAGVTSKPDWKGALDVRRKQLQLAACR